MAGVHAVRQDPGRPGAAENQVERFPGRAACGPGPGGCGLHHAGRPQGVRASLRHRRARPCGPARSAGRGQPCPMRHRQSRGRRTRRGADVPGRRRPLSRGRARPAGAAGFCPRGRGMLQPDAGRRAGRSAQGDVRVRSVGPRGRSEAGATALRPARAVHARIRHRQIVGELGHPGRRRDRPQRRGICRGLPGGRDVTARRLIGRGLARRAVRSGAGRRHALGRPGRSPAPGAARGRGSGHRRRQRARPVHRLGLDVVARAAGRTPVGARRRRTPPADQRGRALAPARRHPRAFPRVRFAHPVQCSHHSLCLDVDRHLGRCARTDRSRLLGPAPARTRALCRRPAPTADQARDGAARGRPGARPLCAGPAEQHGRGAHDPRVHLQGPGPERRPGPDALLGRRLVVARLPSRLGSSARSAARAADLGSDLCLRSSAPLDRARRPGAAATGPGPQ